MDAELVVRIVVTSQVFVTGYEPVNGAVTWTADGDRGLHFRSCEPLLKPFVGVAEPRDEMMKRQPLLTAAELAVLLFFVF